MRANRPRRLGVIPLTYFWRPLTPLIWVTLDPSVKVDSAVRIGRAVWGRGVSPRKKKAHNLATSPPRGGATARPIFSKLGSFGLWPDVITYAKSYVSIFHRVRLARGSILAFQHYNDCRL